MPPSKPIVLTSAEARVLGALIEKEVTTPDYYPMSMNALISVRTASRLQTWTRMRCGRRCMVLRTCA